MGIVKSVQPVAPLVHSENKDAVAALSVNLQQDNIPQAVMSYFGAREGSVDASMMKEISDWAFSNTERASDALRKIKNLELKLGQPSVGETRYNRMHRWIVLQRQRDEITAQQRLLRR